MPARRCMMHAWYGEHDASRPCPTSLDHACTRWSNSGLQVEDLKVSVTPFVVQRAADVSVSSTVAELYGHDDDLFGIRLRSWMRNRELHPTTERFHGMDGVPRRQARNNACLGRIGTYSETCTTPSS